MPMYKYIQDLLLLSFGNKVYLETFSLEIYNDTSQCTVDQHGNTTIKTLQKYCRITVI